MSEGLSNSVTSAVTEEQLRPPQGGHVPETDGLCAKCRNIDLRPCAYKDVDLFDNPVAWRRLADAEREPGCPLCRFVCATRDRNERAKSIPPGNITYDLEVLSRSEDYLYVNIVHRSVISRTDGNEEPALISSRWIVRTNCGSIRQLPRLFEVATLKQWLQDCDGCLVRSTEDKSRQIIAELDVHVIDCVEGKLVILPRSCDYLALSYVWGGVSDTTEPFDQDKGPSLACERLPTTIRQAIHLTVAIGKRYL